MMGLAVRRRLVDVAVHAFLVEQLGGRFPWGLARTPREVDVGAADVLYGIVYPVSDVGSGYEAPPFEPEGDVECAYDLRVVAGVAAGYGQCQWAADETARVLFTRQPWGAPVFPISIEKHEEMDRSAIGSAAPATLTANVWQATHSVRLLVTRTE